MFSLAVRGPASSNRGGGLRGSSNAYFFFIFFLGEGVLSLHAGLQKAIAGEAFEEAVRLRALFARQLVESVSLNSWRLNRAFKEP